jgi:chemotaxis signal transduction protein
MSDFEGREEREEVLARLTHLRRAFDHGFAELPSATASQSETLLSVRIAGRPFAIRMAELAGFQPRRKIVRLPGDVPHLLGLAGIRGKVVPVFDLASLIGCGRASDAWRWLLLGSAQEPIGLAFDEFEGYLQVLRSDLYSVRDKENREEVREAVSVGGVARGVVNLGSILTGLGRGAAPPKER